VKEIIFFDGDGTLWYPKKTRYTKHPVWVYQDPRIKNYADHLVLTPSAFSTIMKLKRSGITIVLLSTHPHPPKEADSIIKSKAAHFNIEDIFDEIHATRISPDSKGKMILKILKKRRIPKSKALMIGDSYRWDYDCARKVGVDALLIRSDYEDLGRKVRRRINKLSDLFPYLR
jgi:phosphoglycolate phosphatase-like HAD superfamily hydrolase